MTNNPSNPNASRSIPALTDLIPQTSPNPSPMPSPGPGHVVATPAPNPAPAHAAPASAAQHSAQPPALGTATPPLSQAPSGPASEPVPASQNSDAGDISANAGAPASPHWPMDQLAPGIYYARLTDVDITARGGVKAGIQVLGPVEDPAPAEDEAEDEDPECDYCDGSGWYYSSDEFGPCSCHQGQINEAKRQESLAMCLTPVANHNPADVLNGIAQEVAADTGLAVDTEAFAAARDYLEGDSALTQGPGQAPAGALVKELDLAKFPGSSVDSAFAALEGEASTYADYIYPSGDPDCKICGDTGEIELRDVGAYIETEPCTCSAGELYRKEALRKLATLPALPPCPHCDDSGFASEHSYCTCPAGVAQARTAVDEATSKYFDALAAVVINSPQSTFEIANPPSQSDWEQAGWSFGPITDHTMDDSEAIEYKTDKPDVTIEALLHAQAAPPDMSSLYIEDNQPVTFIDLGSGFRVAWAWGSVKPSELNPAEFKLQDWAKDDEARVQLIITQCEAVALDTSDFQIYALGMLVHAWVARRIAIRNRVSIPNIAPIDVFLSDTGTMIKGLIGLVSGGAVVRWKAKQAINIGALFKGWPMSIGMAVTKCPNRVSVQVEKMKELLSEQVEKVLPGRPRKLEISPRRSDESAIEYRRRYQREYQEMRRYGKTPDHRMGWMVMVSETKAVVTFDANEADAMREQGGELLQIKVTVSPN